MSSLVDAFLDFDSGTCEEHRIVAWEILERLHSIKYLTLGAWFNEVSFVSSTIVLSLSKMKVNGTFVRRDWVFVVNLGSICICIMHSIDFFFFFLIAQSIDVF